MRRVVVTGLGLITPVGCGVEESWQAVLAGQSGAGRITKFDPDLVTTKYACEITHGTEAGAYNPNDWTEPSERRKIDDFIVYGIVAAKQAIADSGWVAKTEQDKNRTGVMVGSGIGGLSTLYNTSLLLKERGSKRISPFFVPGFLINLASGQIAIRYGFKGPNHAVVTACSSGAHAIGDASRLIQHGDADVMIAGGTEAAITPLGIAGFNACKALSTKYINNPKIASRPYDMARDGFVMGEGAGMMVLEEYEHAKARGAKIYCELSGYGLSGDAHHVTAPPDDGNGAERAMRAALKQANITPNSIDYVNAHGTSTMADMIELHAFERLVGSAASNISMSSTKSCIGHLLGAAGAVEAIFCVLAIRDQVAPPTINLDNPAVETTIDLVPNEKRMRKIEYALSNSFGFGGTNASVIMKKVS